ncbi:MULTISPECIES: OmpH family outer membrane protein [unclassified Chryseobacterium]|uniref:OmpH family outer membrane protein n=1 Tax=unclassified Chryseobacterium TaxID=2593645 RepID=UPI000953B7C4|nr:MULTISPECIES: OmpH family outer membrane protein [unclassified Chryseobacterium]SIR55971.1 Outer membrane protein (OmpH-like) [Chryseobacterium sp. RU33C]
MSKILSIIFLGSVFISLSAQNTAFIFRSKLASQIKGYEAKVKKIDSLKSEYSKQIEIAGLEINKKYQKLAAPYIPKDGETVEMVQKRMKMADADQVALLIDENRLLENRKKSFQKIVDENYRQTLEPLILKINKVISSYASKNKIETIWYLEDVERSLGYYNKGRDITDVIVNIVNDSK